MDCFFISNLNIKPCERFRKEFNRIIDKEFLPADVVCISGISEDYEMTRQFLVFLGQHYNNVLYVYGGCDMISDMPLDLKFEKIKDSLRNVQKHKSRPIRLDGTIEKIDNIIFGGATGMNPEINIKKWNWWSKDINEIYKDEYSRLIKISENIPDINISYYDPRKMNFKINGKYWNFGEGKKKEISEIGETILINNTCLDKSKKFTKENFLIKL